jgi:repressor LexA
LELRGPFGSSAGAVPDLSANIRLGDQERGNPEMNQELTERQNQILDYIRTVTRQRNYPPSVREIGSAVGLSSSSTVHNHLNQLERRGLIRRDPSKSRTVQLTEDVEYQELRRNAVPVPVIGQVAAGTPILADQNIEDHLLLAPQLAREGWFALRVRGDSMVGAGILEGDMVLVQPQKDAPDGTVVVALVGDEATVKRLDRTSGQVRLLSENPSYPPLYPEQVALVGIVRGLLRNY